MARGGGLRSPPQNGGRGGGRRDSRQHNSYWHLVAPINVEEEETPKLTPAIKTESSSCSSPKAVVARTQAIIQRNKDEVSRPALISCSQSSVPICPQGVIALPESSPGSAQPGAVDQNIQSSQPDSSSDCSSDEEVDNSDDGMEESAGDTDSNSDMEEDQREQVKPIPMHISGDVGSDDSMGTARVTVSPPEFGESSKLLADSPNCKRLEPAQALDLGVENPPNFRCSKPLLSSPIQQLDFEARPPSVCVNATEYSHSACLPSKPSNDLPLQPRGMQSSTFAWNKVQFVKLDKLPSESFLAKDGMSMEPEVAAVHENIAKLDKALVAKLMGRRVAFPYLIGELKRRWYQFGEFNIITTAPNSFICLFQSIEARDAVLMSGPWIIAGNIIGMDKWSPTSSPNSLHGLHSPIWIRLPQLPLLYWDTNNITRLANMLGEPLWMDSHTSTWGRSSYARICVRIDLSQKLQAGIWINGIHGRFFQRVEYEGLTNFCFDCGFIGHANGTCTSKAHTRGPQSPPLQSSPPTNVQASSKNVSHEPAPPLKPKQSTVGEPSLSENKDESSLGAWNLVTRRRKGKPRAPKDQDSSPQVEPPFQFSAEKLQQMEDTSNRIVNSRKQHPRVTKSRLDRELLRLGPLSALATAPRKRKKTSTDFTGGDFVPSSA